MTRTFNLTVEWDAEANVFVATSTDLPGLVTEAPTIGQLEARLTRMAPELIELNRLETDDGGVAIDLHLRKRLVIGRS